MSKTHEIKVTKRELQRKGASRRGGVRREDHVTEIAGSRPTRRVGQRRVDRDVETPDEARKNNGVRGADGQVTSATISNTRARCARDVTNLDRQSRMGRAAHPCDEPHSHRCGQ